MSAVFLVTFTNKRKTCKALYALWFNLHLSVFTRWLVHEKPKVTSRRKVNKKLNIGGYIGRKKCS